MKRIDFYLQHLFKHEANEVVLASAKPVVFRFAAGDRQSNTPIDHATISQLVTEAAPASAIDQISKGGKAKFTYTGDAGLPANVTVEALGPGSWKVSLAPAGKSVGMDEARPAPAPVAAQPPAKKEEPKKEIQIVVEGEPRLNRFLRMMIKVGASDLHMSSDETPLIRHDGEMRPLEPGSAKLTTEQLRDILMEAAPERSQLEFAERNDADFAHMIPGVARFRANYFLDRKGIGAVFRQIPFGIISPEKLGLPKQVLDLCYLSKGLVLVTGPTGSGKSTTLASLIDYINKNRSDHIITIEDPIEFVHDNQKCLVNQREVHNHTQSFKSALRAALREDPDIVLVGEMRDLETISIAIETAETGHLVFGTLHTTTAPSTVDRLIDQFPADRQEQIRTMLSESLRGVVAQMLCKKIGGGRVAAYEILISNPAVGNLIREGKTYQLVSVMQTGRNLGMITMNEHLLEHVKAGRVEPREAYIKAVDKLGLKDMFTKNNIQLDL